MNGLCDILQTNEPFRRRVFRLQVHENENNERDASEIHKIRVHGRNTYVRE